MKKPSIMDKDLELTIKLESSSHFLDAMAVLTVFPLFAGIDMYCDGANPQLGAALVLYSVAQLGLYLADGLSIKKGIYYHSEDK